MTDFDVKPADYSDAGNANVFQTYYRGMLAYTDALGWLYFNGKNWERNEHKAVGKALELSKAMLDDASIEMTLARHRQGEAETAAAQKLDGASDELKKAREEVSKARKYLQHAINSRNAPRVMGMLKLAANDMVVPADYLDADPFALNTPDGEVDLRTGKLTPHGIDTPYHWCTNITKVPPVSPDSNPEGHLMWYKFLEVILCNDNYLAGFLQQVAGMALIGAVYHEGIVIAHGGGRNGKSTFFNALADVLGSYAGTIDVKVLTTDRQNKGAALATLRGKRLVIAGELEEHQRLSTSTLKQLASTDKLTIEEKFKQPETVKQSHTLVLFTNFLPRVGSMDNGTWRRLLVIPFNAVISEQDSVQNYAEMLVEKAGGAILSWAIQGAVDFIKNGFKLVVPDVVAMATEEYQNRENWLENFIDERCIKEPNARVGARALYDEYKRWAQDAGEYVRREADFSTAMEAAGYDRIKPKNKSTWVGVRLDLAVQFGGPYTAMG